MGGRQLQTLSDCERYSFEIKATCSACGHSSLLVPYVLDRKFRARGWSRYLDSIGAHLRCGQCNARNPKIQITDEARRATKAGEPLAGDKGVS